MASNDYSGLDAKIVAPMLRTQFSLNWRQTWLKDEGTRHEQVEAFVALVFPLSGDARSIIVPVNSSIHLIDRYAGDFCS